jgi:hypothetical protein
MTADRDFLFWLRDRLVHQYGEDENTDFVLKLNAIAQETSPGIDTQVWSDEPRYKGRFRVFPAIDSAPVDIFDMNTGKPVSSSFPHRPQALGVCASFNLLAQKLARVQNDYNELGEKYNALKADRNIPS